MKINQQELDKLSPADLHAYKKYMKEKEKKYSISREFFDVVMDAIQEKLSDGIDKLVE